MYIDCLMQDIQYRYMKLGEESSVSELALKTFNEFIAYECTDEGIYEIKSFFDPEAIKKRSEENSFVLVSVSNELIVGMLEMQEYRHLSMLFVNKEFHRNGIARGLLNKSIEIALSKNPRLRNITVNSSRYAEPVYQRMGFVRTQRMQIEKGIKYIPMALKLI